jgi:hypothetical protein
MLWLIIVFLMLCLAASVWLNVHVVRKNLILADQREELVDTIEVSLDTLDNCYSNIARSAEIPVLSDEPVIREVLSDIKRAKNAVLAIASKVVIYGEEKGLQKDE